MSQHRPNVVSLAIKAVRDTFVFSGRSTRSEVLAFGLLSMLAGGLVRICLPGDPFAPPSAAMSLWSLALMLPLPALMIRRVHDHGRSGWWALVLAGLAVVEAIALRLPQTRGGVRMSLAAWDAYPTPGWAAFLLGLLFLALSLALFALLIAPPSFGENRYGPDPRTGPPEPAAT